MGQYSRLISWRCLHLSLVEVRVGGGGLSYRNNLLGFSKLPHVGSANPFRHPGSSLLEILLFTDPSTDCDSITFSSVEFIVNQCSLPKLAEKRGILEYWNIGVLTSSARRKHHTVYNIYFGAQCFANGRLASHLR